MSAGPSHVSSLTHLLWHARDVHTRLQKCAQLLLTLDNLANRSQYLNARTTFIELLSYGVVPIVNENVRAVESHCMLGRGRM